MEKDSRKRKKFQEGILVNSIITHHYTSIHRKSQPRTENDKKDQI